MPRYEYSDENFNKFWEIEVKGKSHTRTYGPIGEDGTSTTKEFESEEKAQKDAEKQIKAKLKKGYLPEGEEVVDVIHPVAPANPELEALVAADLNGDSLAVFGDYLQSHGDPMGELIAMHVAKGKGKKKDVIELLPLALRRAVEFKVRQERYSRMREAVPLKFDWDGIFIRDAWFGTSFEYNGPQPPELLGEFWNRACGKFIQRLTLGQAVANGANDYAHLLGVLKSAGTRLALKTLYIGDLRMEESDISHSYTGDVGPLLPLYPNLEYLKLYGGDIYISKAKHDKLKTLIIETGGLGNSCVASLAAANFPAMESMTVYFGQENYGASGDIKTLKPLFKNKNLPKLKHLGLVNSEFQDEIAEHLKGSSLVAGLKTLELTKGTMTDRGGQALLDAVDDLKHLRRIEIDENYVGDEICDKLRKAYGSRISIGSQEGPQEDGEYYTSVGE